MSGKKKQFAGLEMIAGIPDPKVSTTKSTDEPSVQPKAPGQAAVEQELQAQIKEKKKRITLQLSTEDADLLETLSMKLKRYGLPLSAGNGVRLAVRLFNASESEVERIANELLSEDKRRA
jgi:hypothetical protein